MSGARGLRLQTSSGLKEKRLAALLAGRSEDEASLRSLVRDAQLLGSLELSGFAITWDAVRASTPPPEVEALRRAQLLLEPQATVTSGALLEWHRTLVGEAAGFRREARTREGGPPPAPPEFVEGRLRLLEEWLGGDSGRELGAAQAGALTLARIVEVLPFEDANGRVSRLAASHVMVRAGARPPILVRADGERLRAALQQAFRLETEPLARLLEEASVRCLHVLIQALEGKGGGG
jgi:hypothetical protein